jgi:hypothetical protein
MRLIKLSKETEEKFPEEIKAVRKFYWMQLEKAGG